MKSRHYYCCSDSADTKAMELCTTHSCSDHVSLVSMSRTSSAPTAARRMTTSPTSSRRGILCCMFIYPWIDFVGLASTHTMPLVALRLLSFLPGVHAHKDPLQTRFPQPQVFSRAEWISIGVRGGGDGDEDASDSITAHDGFNDASMMDGTESLMPDMDNAEWDRYIEELIASVDDPDEHPSSRSSPRPMPPGSMPELASILNGGNTPTREVDVPDPDSTLLSRSAIEVTSQPNDSTAEVVVQQAITMTVTENKNHPNDDATLHGEENTNRPLLDVTVESVDNSSEESSGDDSEEEVESDKEEEINDTETTLVADDKPIKEETVSSNCVTHAATNTLSTTNSEQTSPPPVADPAISMEDILKMEHSDTVELDATPVPIVDIPDTSTSTVMEDPISTLESNLSPALLSHASISNENHGDDSDIPKENASSTLDAVKPLLATKQSQTKRKSRTSKDSSVPLDTIQQSVIVEGGAVSSSKENRVRSDKDPTKKERTHKKIREAQKNDSINPTDDIAASDNGRAVPIDDDTKQVDSALGSEKEEELSSEAITVVKSKKTRKGKKRMKKEVSAIKNDEVEASMEPRKESENATAITVEPVVSVEATTTVERRPVPRSRVLPNPIYRFLLHQGRVGHSLVMTCVVANEWIDTYVPPLGRFMAYILSYVFPPRYLAPYPSASRSSPQNRATMPLSGTRTGQSTKQQRQQLKRADQAALQKLKQVGNVQQSKYRHVSDDFLRRHGLGPYSKLDTKKDPSDKLEPGMQQSVAEDEEDDTQWVVESLTKPSQTSGKKKSLGVQPSVSIGVGPTGPSVTVGFNIGGTASATKQARATSFAQVAASSQRRRRTAASRRVSDREGGDGLMGRIRVAAGANSRVSRSLLGAYPGDAVPIEEAASPRGVIDLARRYGYGEWSEEEDEDDNESMSTSPSTLMEGFTRVRRTRRVRRKKTHTADTSSGLDSNRIDQSNVFSTRAGGASRAFLHERLPPLSQSTTLSNRHHQEQPIHRRDTASSARTFQRRVEPVRPAMSRLNELRKKRSEVGNE
jgi:hypothetical protein